MDKYVVRECNSDDYQKIADFFNNNEAYQINNDPLTSEDISISFDLKEVRHFYGLFLNDKLVGTTALFDFIFEAKHFNESIFSGFLLIDPSLRNGSAIRKLFLTLQKNSNIIGNKSYFCEINVENKASLQLSKLNGYTLFDKSWEDPCHYLLFRSDLSKLKKVTKQFIGKENKNIYKLKKSFWKNGSYFASFYLNHNIVEFGINSDNPWFIKSNDFTIYFENNCLYWKLNIDSSIKKLVLEFDNKKYSTNELNSFLNIDNNISTISIKIVTQQNTIFRHYYLDNKIVSDAEESRFSIQLGGLKVPFTSLSVDKHNGDIIYYIDNESIISDVFPRTDSSLKANVKISFEKDTLNIIVENSISRIEKTVIFKDDLIFNKMKFYCKTNLLSKYGIRILHNNYLLTENDDIDKFYAYKIGNDVNSNTPEENMDFAKKDLFNEKDKYYYLPEYNMQFKVSSNELSSNQMTYRPLIINRLNQYEDGQKANYEISFNELMDSISSKPKNRLEDYSRSKLRIKKIYRRSEPNDLPTFISTLVNVPQEVEYINSDDVLEVARSSGAYTGLYFNFKMQGNIFAKDDLRSIKLFENGEWLEFHNYLAIVNESKKSYLIFRSTGNRIFVYKKYNTIYMRIVSKNDSKDKIKINIEEI